ncbi:PWWP domain containing protein [Salix suchowensis]|nr:PWWP domain containing protein [Salix suchowensis]
MEESSGTAAAGEIGPIVWVRRRNGSWWPGHIMEADELAEYNLTSPRTGTPVKLLGRDDASVDWYNLEKSKRVKAFRCAEFSDCIKRAESALGMPIKKREKYARREDAILHALELEKQLLIKQGKLGVAQGSPRSKSSGPVKSELGAFSEGLVSNIGKPEDVKSNLPSRGVDTEIADSPLIPLKTKDGDQTVVEDHSEEMLRMRGLQDFRLRTALKRKLSPSVELDGSWRRPIADHKYEDPPNVAPLVEITAHANGKTLFRQMKVVTEGLTGKYLVKGCDGVCFLILALQNIAYLEINHLLQSDCFCYQLSGSEKMRDVFQAKRRVRSNLPADSSDSTDDKELPPSKNKMSSSCFEDRVHSHAGSSNEEESSSGFREDIESDYSGSNYSESVSDSSQTEPDLDKEIAVFSDVAVPIEGEKDVPGQPDAPAQHASTSSDESDASMSSDDMDNLYHDDLFLANEAVSKWQLKGKRNIRYLTQKPVNMEYGKGSNGASHGTFYRMKESFSSQWAYGAHDVNSGRKYIGSKLYCPGNRGYSYSSSLASRDQNNTGRSMIEWEGMGLEDQYTFGRHWEDRGEHSNPIFVGHHTFGGRARSMLIDVDLKVKSCYQKDRVPIVSLISKLDGKAIIGHQILIEAVEDGSSETYFPLNDYYSNEAVDHDEGTSLPPAWRTARRTNSRVPRPHLPSMLGVDAGAEDVPFMDQERSVPFRKSSVGSFSYKTNLVRKSLPHISRSSADKKSPRKLPKKASLPSNQKTRTLSSIGIKQKFATKPMHDTSNGQMDGLIKPETSAPTTVACIPVKLVFSRLLEKINRPPSRTAIKVVVVNMDGDREAS